MTNLLSRLERLEREQPAMRQRFIWFEPDETGDQASSRTKPLEPGELPLFVGWRFGGAQRPAKPTHAIY